MKKLDELNDKIIANLEEGNEIRDILIKALESQVKDQKQVIKNLKIQLEIMEMRVQLWRNR